MRLYLSSFDLGDRPEELVALSGPASRAAIIVNALDSRPDVRARFLKEQTGKLIGLGFSVFELDLRSYFGRSDKLEVLLRDIDLVWVNGGNAFILRRAMNKADSTQSSKVPWPAMTLSTPGLARRRLSLLTASEAWN